jgi:ribosome-associated toxin RatA of RatAB toxin-antitoxin module
MANLRFQTNSPIEPEKLFSRIIDFESYQKFFPNQIKSIEVLEQQNNEITTEETIIFSTLIKSAFVQKSHHKIISDKELCTKIIDGPAKSSIINVVCAKNNQGSQITFDIDLKLSLKAKFLGPFIKKLYKRYLIAVIYKISAHENAKSTL